MKIRQITRTELPEDLYAPHSYLPQGNVRYTKDHPVFKYGGYKSAKNVRHITGLYNEQVDTFYELVQYLNQNGSTYVTALIEIDPDSPKGNRFAAMVYLPAEYTNERDILMKAIPHRYNLISL